MILQRIKIELFFIRRLLQEGFGPRYWWSYFKNRFFGNYLFTFLPKCEYEPDPDLELHTICSRYGQGLWMFAWMVRSFLYHSGLKPTIIIHDDGTIDQATADLITSRFPTARVSFHKKTAEDILKMSDVPGVVKEARKKCHFFMDKLIDTVVFSKAKKILITDSDILYYSIPTEVVDFLMGNTDVEALVQRQINEEIIFDLAVDEEYYNKYRLADKNIALMNGGYLMINKDKVGMDKLVDFLEHNKRPIDDYFIEMGGWACILGQLNFKFLDPERYAIKGLLNDKMVMKHYTSPRRYEMFAYGIDKARKKLSN